AEQWKLDASKTVKDELVSQIAVIGENMNIRRFAKIEANDGIVASYIHMGGKIGTLVYAQTDVVNDDIKTALYNVAMQVTALNPKFITDEDVDQDYINHEKEILLAQIQNDPKESQKPEKVIEGMIMGRIKKELKEVVLYDQAYFQAADGKQTVAAYIDEVAKANGANIKIKEFVRFETGEGLEKKEEDFAAEVAKQMQ
ncbi:MAG TPA: translation elongation factor Ts, partial [Eubacterium sp.]|nr:translation elongation factor Ts [Eubacterium sp.]